MKKIVSIVTILMIFSILITGCSKAFDMNESVKELKELGLVEGEIYNAEKLHDTNELANSQIKAMGGNFTVEIVKQYSLTDKSDSTMACNFLTFKTAEQATNFADIFVKTFAKDGNPNNWKFAHSDRVVIFTNIEGVLEVIDLEFK